MNLKINNYQYVNSTIKLMENDLTDMEKTKAFLFELEPLVSISGFLDFVSSQDKNDVITPFMINNWLSLLLKKQKIKKIHEFLDLLFEKPLHTHYFPIVEELFNTILNLSDDDKKTFYDKNYNEPYINAFKFNGNSVELYSKIPQFLPSLLLKYLWCKEQKIGYSFSSTSVLNNSIYYNLQKDIQKILKLDDLSYLEKFGQSIATSIPLNDFKFLNLDKLPNKQLIQQTIATRLNKISNHSFVFKNEHGIQFVPDIIDVDSKLLNGGFFIYHYLLSKINTISDLISSTNNTKLDDIFTINQDLSHLSEQNFNLSFIEQEKLQKHIEKAKRYIELYPFEKRGLQDMKNRFYESFLKINMLFLTHPVADIKKNKI